MRKFTVFSVILTVVVIVAVSELAVNEYLPKIRTKDKPLETGELTLPDNLEISDVGGANVLGSGLDNKLGADIDFGDIEDQNNADVDAKDVNLLGSDVELFTDETDLSDSFVDEITIGGSLSGDSSDFESTSFVSSSPTVFIREDQARSAGFTSAYLEKEAHNGLLYKAIVIDDLVDTDITKYVIRDQSRLFAKVYIFRVGSSSSIDEVYQVLKVRGSAGLDIELNETNEFGRGSFYMNDTRRLDVAFLTVKIGEYIYGFSYPKDYHPQVKNLIELIDMEI